VHLPGRLHADISTEIEAETISLYVPKKYEPPKPCIPLRKPSMNMDVSLLKYKRHNNQTRNQIRGGAFDFSVDRGLKRRLWKEASHH